MKNINPNYTYQELVHYLDISTTDPMVRRLIDMIIGGENTVLEQLIEEGMDPVNQTFYHDHEELDPGTYIHHLKRDCTYFEEEMIIAQNERDEEQEKRKRLETRSVADLLASMEELVKRAKSETDNANRITRKVAQENDELKEKINVWTIMESK
jgi:hypothetical protein